MPSSNHSTRAPLVYSLTIPSLFLMILFISARLYSRAVILNTMGYDDWIIGVAAVFAIAVSCLALVSLDYGLGRHIRDQKPQWYVPYNKMGFAADILFPISTGLTKISLCITYLRLFPSRSNRIFCWMLIAFVSLYTLTCELLMVLQCSPLSTYWTPPSPTSPPHCINMRATLLSTAALNSLSDVLVFLWPTHPLCRVQLPLKKRVNLVLMFAVGCTVCGAGVGRMVGLEVYFREGNPLWNASTIYAVMAIEQNIGITCGCISSIKPLLTLLFPRALHSTSASPKHHNIDNRE